MSVLSNLTFLFFITIYVTITFTVLVTEILLTCFCLATKPVSNILDICTLEGTIKGGTTHGKVVIILQNSTLQHLVATMSISLHLVGDSNIDRYLPLVKAVKEDPGIQEATFLRATNMVQLQEALVPSNPTTAHPNVVLACMTNPITNFPFEDFTSLMSHCTKTFTQIQAWIQEGRGALPGTLSRVSF